MTTRDKKTARPEADTRGISPCGPTKWKVRVKVTDPVTRRPSERKATVEGSLLDAIKVRDELRAGAERRQRPTLRDYSTSWLERRVASRRIGPATAEKYARDLGNHVLPILGDALVDQLRPSHVEPVLGSGWAGINRLRMLRTMARDAVADGVADSDFTLRLSVPTPPGYTDEDPNRLTADELGCLLAVAAETEPRWYAWLVVIGYTGLRFGEASGLRWEDVDFGVGAIHVRGKNYKGTYVPRPKTKRPRRVPVGPELAAVLQEHRRLQLAEQRPGLASGWVFCSSGGTLHRGSPLRAVLDRLCERASVTRITAHGLRRTFNDLGRRVVDRMVVKAITGHVTDAMFEHYSHVDQSEKLEAQSRVLRLVQGGGAVAVTPVTCPSCGGALAPEPGLRDDVRSCTPCGAVYLVVGGEIRALGTGAPAAPGRGTGRGSAS